MNAHCFCSEKNRFFVQPWVFFCGFLILSLDILSKAWVNHHIPVVSALFYEYPYGGMPVFNDFLGIQFSLNHITNTGAAWGIFGAHPLLLVILRCILIFFLNLYLFFWNRKKAWTAPLMLISVGAIGNVLDYLLYGHVIDMFHFVFWNYDFPVFNIADAAISIGVIWLFILSWCEVEA